MATITICSDFGAQKNKVSHCFHCFPIICHEVRFSNKMLAEGWDDEIKGMLLFGVPSRNMKGKCKSTVIHTKILNYFSGFKKGGCYKRWKHATPEGNRIPPWKHCSVECNNRSRNLCTFQTCICLADSAPCSMPSYRGVGWRCEWEGDLKKGDICILVADSHCCTAEISTAL